MVMSVFRLHIRPKGGRGDIRFSFEYCLRSGVLGVGWPVESAVMPVTWERYLELAAQKYGSGEISRVQYFHDNLKPGDLIWTRSPEGKYFLARADAQNASAAPDRLAWQYLGTTDGLQADIVNIVRCRILAVPELDRVPGKVIACFRPSRTIQAIADTTAVLYTQLLWNRLASTQDFDTAGLRNWDIFTLLDDEAAEDLVFIYLQTCGWIILPNSRKSDTMRYEFLGIHRESGQRAIVQVKTGATPLSTSGWTTFQEHVYLFQTKGIYVGVPDVNVSVLQPAEMKTFIKENLDIMPRSIQEWITFCRS